MALLEKLENEYDDFQENDIDLFENDNISIEHIFRQNPSSEWKNKLSAQELTEMEAEYTALLNKVSHWESEEVYFKGNRDGLIEAIKEASLKTKEALESCVAATGAKSMAEAAAEAAGLVYHYLPVVSGAYTPEQVTQMAALVNGAPGPVDLPLVWMSPERNCRATRISRSGSVVWM